MKKPYLKWTLPLVAVALGFAWQVSAADKAAKLDPKQQEFFEKRIRPVLATACYDCHSSAAKIKGGLVLDNKEGLLKGGDTGPAIVPGNPEKSLLVKAITYHDEDDLKMPPKADKRLSDDQIADLVAWIRMGAPDPRVGNTPAVIAVNIEKARNHWAFQPVENPSVPAVKDPTHFVHTDIDKFILAKLQAKHLTPATPADKRTLIRRAAYDLIGLPPTPEEVEDFVNDKSPNAFAKVVDRYLASPRYGERWGRHWLDVARYADNTGDRQNRGRPLYPFAWTYRDYVIKAFNSDKPFDQFIKEQIAADQFVKGDDKSNLAAMGFLTVGKRFMGNKEDVLDDRIDVVTQGFLALTVSCARCHDHKFDPIPTTDYYSLHGIFENSVEPEDGPYLQEPKDTPQYRDFKDQVAALEQQVTEVGVNECEKAMSKVRSAGGDILLANYRYGTTGKANKELRTYLNKNGINFNAYQIWSGGLRKLAKKPDAIFKPWFDYAALSKDDFASKAPEITAALSKADDVNPLIADALVKADPKSIEDVANAYGNVFQKVEKSWKSQKLSGSSEMPDKNEQAIYTALTDSRSPFHITMKEARNMVGGAKIAGLENRVEMKILQLETSHPGSPARAMVLEDASKIRASFVLIRGERGRRGDRVDRHFLQILSKGEPKPFVEGSGRKQLAEAIADRNNPLTARVIVNRIWAQHFGEGLVRTLSDFGLRAEPPSHPELLDHLATWFMDNGWSIKKLQRYIMLSGVYQEGSMDNEKYALIDPANQYLWKMPIQRLDFESLRDTLLVAGGNIDLKMGGNPVDITESTTTTRRTVYSYVDRFSLPEMFRTFDFANPDMTTSVRLPTTVPQQALFMMNSPFVIEQARLMVQRTDFSNCKTDADKVQFMFQTLYQRNPTASEQQMALAYLSSQASKDVKDDPGKQDWSYGLGYYNPKIKQVRMRPFESSNGNALLGGKKSGNAFLNAFGGTPGSSRKYGIVRRWTAPKDGRVFISGPVIHRGKTGDGIHAMVIASRQGELGDWNVFNGRQDVTIEHVDVKTGDTIDFVVDSKADQKDDRFNWAPVIRMEEGPEWNARTQFSIPDSKGHHTPLNSWEKLAQALFQTNELVYLN